MGPAEYLDALVERPGLIPHIDFEEEAILRRSAVGHSSNKKDDDRKYFQTEPDEENHLFFNTGVWGLDMKTDDRFPT